MNIKLVKLEEGELLINHSDREEVYCAVNTKEE